MITFLGTGINESRLRMAYNNDILRFYSSLGEASYCDITIGATVIRLYPDPSGSFWVNLKPYVAALINTKYFDDTLQPDLDIEDMDSYIYGYSDGVLLELDVVISIKLADDSTDEETHPLIWIAGVQQIGSYIDMADKHLTYMLTPFRKETANHYYMKYWQGYPFDVALYCVQPIIYLDNTTNLLSTSFEVPEKVSRIVLSDGRTDTTIEEFLPIADGYNTIRIKQDEEDSVDDKFITLVKEPYKCGVYFKWLNKFGGFSYWLFENTAAVDRSVKSLGDLANDFANADETTGNMRNIGMAGQDTIKVITEILNPYDRDIVEGILESPKVYMFTGAPFSQNGALDWVEVTLKSNGARVQNFKDTLTSISLDFDLPTRYTQTL